MWHKEVFIVKEWNSSDLMWKKLDYLLLKDFLNYECESYLKQPLISTLDSKLLLLIGPWIIDLPLRLDDGQLSQSLKIPY